ncbi:MAG: protein kinase [Actinomycetota bacterium]
MALAPNAALGSRYVLKQEIGRDGAVSVWLAKDTVLARQVSVRILLANGDRDARERFAAEAKGAARITHPNVVGAFDTGAENGTPYIVEEFVDGEPLEQLLSREGSLRPDRAVDISLQILWGLDAAHQAGVVHGGLDASVVFVGDGDRVKVTRFGHAAGNQASPESDVRAAAALLYRSLTGRAPGRATGSAPRAVRADVPRGLDAVVLRALSTGERFDTAQSMIAALSRVRPQATASPAGHADSTGHQSFFHSWMLVPILLAAVAGILLVAGLALGRLEIGGPLLIRPAEGSESIKRPPKPQVVTLPVEGAAAIDPFGDDQEGSDDAPLAIDGDRSTFWRTENYFDGVLGKPGVGLLFDLGEARTVTGFKMRVPFEGFDYEVRVGSDPDALLRARGFDFEAGDDGRENLRPQIGRYLLVWVTSVADAGNGEMRAGISELKVFGLDE